MKLIWRRKKKFHSRFMRWWWSSPFQMAASVIFVINKLVENFRNKNSLSYFVRTPSVHRWWWSTKVNLEYSSYQKREIDGKFIPMTFMAIRNRIYSEMIFGLRSRGGVGKKYKKYKIKKLTLEETKAFEFESLIRIFFAFFMKQFQFWFQLSFHNSFIFVWFFYSHKMTATINYELVNKIFVIVWLMMIFLYAHI